MSSSPPSSDKAYGSSGEVFIEEICLGSDLNLLLLLLGSLGPSTVTCKKLLSNLIKGHGSLGRLDGV